MDNKVYNEDEDNEDNNGGFFFFSLYSTGTLLFLTILNMLL